MNKNDTTRKCSRCHGEGYFAHLSHVRGGTCFKCEGTGKVTIKGSDTLAAEAAANEARLANLAINMELAAEVFAAHPEMKDLVCPHTDRWEVELLAEYFDRVRNFGGAKRPASDTNQPRDFDWEWFADGYNLPHLTDPA